jgi:hypothetical protein
MRGQSWTICPTRTQSPYRHAYSSPIPVTRTEDALQLIGLHGLALSAEGASPL